jgi:Fe-S-cluster-containing dehydrogenase component
MSTSPRWKMALDVERCIGCHACSGACKVEHNVPLGRFRTKIYYWDEGKFPKVKRWFLPTLCMRCEDAPCMKACPHSAIGRGRGDIWWDKRKGGTGACYNVDAILPIQPAPLVGMQGWYDTVCSIRKIALAANA